VAGVAVTTQFPFWTEEKLRIQDTDLNGHVNNASIAAL
jgi:acyl-CoA thioester hydrolase